jgi:hypothetical protein
MGAEAVIYKALSQTISSGPLTWEAATLTDNEKAEEIQWMACHVLASLIQEGFQVRREDNGASRTGPGAAPKA